MGFRGDWKALVALFNFVRHYSTNEVWCEQFFTTQNLENSENEVCFLFNQSGVNRTFGIGVLAM